MRMNEQAPPSTHPAQVRWRCHRGMWELDLLLLPFFDRHFVKLTPGQQVDFCRLLEHPDPDLYAWLLGLEQPSSDTGVQDLVNIIRAAHTSTAPTT